MQNKCVDALEMQIVPSPPGVLPCCGFHSFIAACSTFDESQRASLFGVQECAACVEWCKLTTLIANSTIVCEQGAGIVDDRGVGIID